MLSKPLFGTAFLLSLGLAFPGQPAAAQSTGVDDAVAAIVQTLEDQGFEVPLIVDHAAAADSVGLELRPTQLVYARPGGQRGLERWLLSRSPTAAIDLPIKYLVFEDAQGNVVQRFNPVGYLTDRHGIEANDVLFRLTDLASAQFGDARTGLVTQPSTQSLTESLDDLLAALAGVPDIRVPLVLDYDDDPSLAQGPVLVIFGNPNIGTALMQATQETGIDLPLEILLWQNDEGVFVTYNDPLFIAQRHGVQGEEDTLATIQGALANFSSIAAGL